MLSDFLLFAGSLFVLFAGGAILVRSLSWMGRYFNLSEYFLAFVLISFATTLPELFVGLRSALAGIPELSFGNIVGSSVLDVAMVLGVVVTIGGGLAFNRVVSKEDVRITLGMMLLPVLLFLDGALSRFDGAVLLFFFVGYMYYLGGQERVSPEPNRIDLGEFNFTNFIRKAGLILAGSMLLVGGSWSVVNFGKNISQELGLPIFFVGILVGFGTTLPELVFGITSTFMRHAPMVLGNIFGSILSKFSFVLGLVALIHPITVERPERALFGIVLAAGLIVVLKLTGLINGRIPRWMGLALLLTAAGFLVLEGTL